MFIHLISFFPVFLMAVLSMLDVFGRNHPDGQPARWTSIPQDAVLGDTRWIPLVNIRKTMENHHFFLNQMGFKMVLYGLICLNMFDMFNMANQQTQWAKASSSLCKRLPEDLRAYWDIHGIMECERGLFFIDSIEVHCCLFALCENSIEWETGGSLLWTKHWD